MINSMSINVKQIRVMFFEDHTTLHASRSLFNTYKKKYEEIGFISVTQKTLPKDWFFEQIQLEKGYSDEEIETMKIFHNSLDSNGLKRKRD